MSSNGVYRTSKSIRDVLDWIIERLLVVFMIVLVFSVVLQVLYRFVIVKYVAFSLPFTEELARYLLVWITYLALGVCLKEGLHASFTVLSDTMAPRAGRILHFGIRALMLVFIGVVLQYGIPLALSSTQFTSPTLEVPLALMYAAPCVGLLLIGYQVLVECLGMVTDNEGSFHRKHGDGQCQ